MHVRRLGVWVAWLACAVVLAEEGLERVASLVRAGNEHQALREIALLSGKVRNDDGLRYLKGRLLLDAGRPCDAMDELGRMPTSLPEPMREDGKRRWARAAARCGQCAEARAALLGIASSEAIVTRRDRAIAAECAVQMGELEAGAEELAQLTRRPHDLDNRVALLALLSDVYLQLGRPDEARQAALEGWISAVHPAEDPVARKLEKRALPSIADRIARAEELMRAHRFTAAVEELEAIEIAKEPKSGAQWHHVYGMALFRTRTRYLDAARILRESARLGGEHEVEDAFHAARALSRADQDARAIRAYRQLAQRHPRSKRAPEARFIAAWLEMRRGRANGEKQMERLVRGKSQAPGRWRRAALWELGFRAFETRRYTRAARYLSEYAAVATDSMDKARGFYWLGRSYRRGPEAVQAYHSAVGVEPLHWYAVLAANRLKQLGRKPPAPFEGAPRPSSVEVPERYLSLPDTFEAYRRLGLDVDGIAWITSHENALVDPHPKAQHIPLLTQLYRDAGSFREALRIAQRRGMFVHGDPAEHRWWWDAAYPMPWRSIVDRHRGELPLGLIYATMRQESGFRPEAVSRAGAVGLMQVMPELAAKLAGRPITPEMLRMPEINIPLGLQEMAALAREFDDVYPLSIAAYNAGESRVKRWLKESRRMELDRFVERIPFEETRNYVRRVMTHYARYSYLDEPGSGWPVLPRFVTP